MSAIATIRNTLAFVLRNPRNAAVVGGKLVQRLRGDNSLIPQSGNQAWMAAHSIASADIAIAIDAEAWAEAQAFERELRARAAPIVATVPFPIATGGAFAFLYWMTRVFRPVTVVETGVAAGYTSASILAAMRRNGSGRLFSSDFPYFRHAEPEKYIGILVAPEDRGNWSLSITGDATALPRIASEVAAIDLFHYDSDKSYAGRDFAMKLALDKLTPDGIVIMDDIWNDSWFHDYVEREKVPFLILDERYGVVGAVDRLRLGP